MTPETFSLVVCTRLDSKQRHRDDDEQRTLAFSRKNIREGNDSSRKHRIAREKIPKKKNY